MLPCAVGRLCAANLHNFRHYLKLCSGKVLGQILLDVFHRVFLDSLVLYRGIEVVEYRIERDAPVLDGFEAQQGVVDAAQLSGGDKDKRVLLLRNVVYRQEIFGKGNHQTAGAFYEHGIIAMGKFPGGTLYFFWLL